MRERGVGRERRGRAVAEEGEGKEGESRRRVEADVCRMREG